MNQIDWIILVVLLLSTGIGLMRGIVREILSIVGWVLGVLLALKFSPEVGELIPLTSVNHTIRTIFAAILLIVITLFVIGMLGRLIGRAMSAARITFEDRMIGSVFGFVRGVVIVCAVVFLFGMTSMTRSESWRESLLIVPCEHVIEFVMPYLPETIADMHSRYKVY